ncbi:MAG: DUF2971 domain-containing protein [Chlorobaculum sp.]|nr:DUF2971 domain-containing protein [Chlorobaculum sp.]
MRSQNRLHDRQNFFKYMSADTARKVLTNRTLRWSSPILFNDPFDVPRELLFGITPDEVVHASGRKMAQLIENPPEDTTQYQPHLRMILEAVKKGISAEQKNKLLSGINKITNSLHPTSKSMDELRDLWRTWLPDHRILCLTESPAHAAMWYHYADKYSGVVLELRCIDEIDSAWLAARPVRYLESKPAIYTAEGWADLLFLHQDVAKKAMLDIATYTKTQDWSYESEWRVASFKRSTDTGNFTDYKLDRQELAALYFGPMIKPEDRLSLVIASGAYPTAQLWDVAIGMNCDFSFNAANT